MPIWAPFMINRLGTNWSKVSEFLSFRLPDLMIRGQGRAYMDFVKRFTAESR